MLKLLSTRMCHSHRGMLEAEIRLWVTTFPLTTVLKKLTSFSIQRPLWRHYYQNTEALMFVVDSNDRERIGEVRDELWRFLAEDELQDCVVLIMANKQDLPNAMSVEQITDKLELNKIKDKTWCKLNISAHTSYTHCTNTYIYWSDTCSISTDIQPSCATSGDGLYNGLDWLHTQLTGEAVKKSVMKPIQETKDSVTKQSTLSSWFNSLSSYWKTSVVQ